MNTQLQKTLTAKIKSATKASCKTMVVEAPMAATEVVRVGDFFVCSWGYEQTNVDFYQVVGVTVKSVKLCEVKKDVVWAKNILGEEDRTAGGYSKPIKDEFISKPFSRRYDFEYQSVKIGDRQIARLWEGRAARFTCYA